MKALKWYKDHRSKKAESKRETRLRKKAEGLATRFRMGWIQKWVEFWSNLSQESLDREKDLVRRGKIERKAEQERLILEKKELQAKTRQRMQELKEIQDRERIEKTQWAEEVLAKFREQGYTRRTPEESRVARKEYIKAHSFLRRSRQGENPSKKIRQKFRHGGSPEIREFYKMTLIMAEVKCEYCGELVPLARRTVDHKIPIGKGGKHEIGNLARACLECNGRKRDLMPEEFRKLLDSKSGSC